MAEPVMTREEAAAAVANRYSSATGGMVGALGRTVMTLHDEVERLRRGMHDIYGLSGSLEDARALAKAHIEASGGAT